MSREGESTNLDQGGDDRTVAVPRSLEELRGFIDKAVDDSREIKNSPGMYSASDELVALWHRVRTLGNSIMWSSGYEFFLELDAPAGKIWFATASDYYSTRKPDLSFDQVKDMLKKYLFNGLKSADHVRNGVAHAVSEVTRRGSRPITPAKLDDQVGPPFSTAVWSAPAEVHGVNSLDRLVQNRQVLLNSPIIIKVNGMPVKVRLSKETGPGRTQYFLQREAAAVDEATLEGFKRYVMDFMRGGRR